MKLNKDGRWIEKALPPVSQVLSESLDRYSSSSGYASCYVGNVEGWLTLIRYAGVLEEQARDLRRSSVKTLLNAKALEEAEQTLQQVRPEDLHLTGYSEKRRSGGRTRSRLSRKRGCMRTPVGLEWRGERLL